MKRSLEVALADLDLDVLLARAEKRYEILCKNPFSKLETLDEQNLTFAEITSIKVEQAWYKS